MVDKVLAYILRQRDGRLELLVHEHRDFPEAGLQIPGGTVESGESIESALLREIHEESGLSDLHIDRLVKRYAWWNESKEQWQMRHMFLLTPQVDPPDNWEHRITGTGEDRNLVFCYRWMPIAQAANQLCAGLGDALKFL